jgi:hypothetical protein
MAKEIITFEDRMGRADAAWALVRAELARAAAKHPQFNSRHEGYAVLLEEVDELWDDVKADRQAPAMDEAVQVAAMAIRFLTDCGTWEKTTVADTDAPEQTAFALIDKRIAAEAREAYDESLRQSLISIMGGGLPDAR